MIAKQIFLVLPLLVWYGACYRDVPVVSRVVRVETKVVRESCLESPPPAHPQHMSCDPPLTALDCADIERGMWADFGRAADLWIDIYAWPRCQVGE